MLDAHIEGQGPRLTWTQQFSASPSVLGVSLCSGPMKSRQSSRAGRLRFTTLRGWEWLGDQDPLVQKPHFQAGKRSLRRKCWEEQEEARHSPPPGTCWPGLGVQAHGEHTAPHGSLRWTETHSAFARCRGSTETPLTPARGRGREREEDRA